MDMNKITALNGLLDHSRPQAIKYTECADSFYMLNTLRTKKNNTRVGIWQFPEMFLEKFPVNVDE